jgi:Bardet-Biedl syndrome 2 protein
VGSDDFDIRVFQGEDILAEVSEADQFVSLCPVHLSRFGYALVNGTIGVYDRLDRIWRVKSKHSVCALASFDLDGDGVPELVSGWSNGRVGACGR